MQTARAAQHVLHPRPHPQPFHSDGRATVGAMDAATKRFKAPSVADLSTAAPSSRGGGGDSDDSMETSTAAKSHKQSEGSSRSNRTRGPARKAKLEARRNAYYDALREKIRLEPDKYPDNLSRSTRQGTAEQATGLAGEGARDAHARLLQDVTLSAQRAHPERTQNQATADWLAYPPPPPLGDKIIQRADGTVFCALCHKQLTEAHLNSALHRERAEEDAIGTLMAGNAGSGRRFERGGRGMPGIPTKRGLLEFWGDALPNLPKAAGKKLEEKGQIDVGGKQDRTLPVSKIAGLRIGIVSYAGAGAGKYTGNKFHYFDDLPDCLDVYDDGRRFGRDNPWAHVGQAPPGEGWWPVLALDLADDLPWWITEGPTVAVGTKKILVICWYQLLGDRVVAWWLTIPVDA